MTPNDLIAAFDALAEAPEGVKRLRELVLELAVRGRLVEQVPEEADVEALPRERVLGNVEKPPHDLAPGWVWTTLSRLGEIRGGGTPSKREPSFWGGRLPWVTPKDMKRDLIESSIDRVTDAAVQGSSIKRIPEGSLLMVVRGMILAHSFPTALTTVEVTVNQDMKALLPFDSRLASYLLVATKGHRSRVLGLVERSTHGTCKLPTKALLEMPLALPPLAEQKRIVARVDELMGLLDRLEAARNAREATRAALRDAALAALQDADSPEEVEVAWARIANNMHDLFIAPADVEPLRQTVLQLAVRGRLAPQDPSDEPAQVLLDGVAAEKAQLVEAKAIRRAMAVAPVGADEAPFELPAGWAWARAEAVLNMVTSGSRGWAKYYAEEGPLFLRIGNLDYETIEIDLTEVQRVQPPAGAEGTRTSVEEGDVLVSITGDTGMVGLAPEGLGEAYINQHVALCRPSSRVSAEYIARSLAAPPSRAQFWGSQRGVKNSLGLDDIRGLLLPLPPLAEQRRIVARLDEILGLIDRLEDRLARELVYQRAAAAAVAQHLEY